MGQPLQEFSKSDLPTGKDVLRQYFYKVKINGNTKKASINSVSFEVLQIWTNEGIPTSQIKHINKKIEKIIDEYKNIAQNINRQTLTQNKREQVFTRKLSTYFDIAHQEAIKIMKSKRYNENNAFLEDQRGPRKMMMRGLDEKNKKKYIRSMKRKRREAMKQKEQSRNNDQKSSNSNKDLQSDLTDADSTTDGESEEDFMCLKKVKKDEVIMMPIHRKKMN